MAYIGAKPVNVPNGGTGAATLTNHGVLLGQATGAIVATAVGTTGTLFRGGTGVDPLFSNTSPGSFSFSANNVGTVLAVTVNNSNNTNTASHAVVSSTVGGTAGGDPLQQFIVTGVTTWTMGIDNSVTTPEDDPFVIASGTSLGTNNVMVLNGSGTITTPLQSAFLAYLGTTVPNVTGNSGVYTLGTTGGTALTEIFDQHNDFNTNGTYTCPVTSRVDLRAAITVTGTTAATSFTLNIVTSNRTYSTIFTRSALAADQSNYLSVIADMDAADTATVNIVVTGEAGNTDDILGGSTLVTYFCGAIVA